MAAVDSATLFGMQLHAQTDSYINMHRAQNIGKGKARSEASTTEPFLYRVL